jgi:hypothetical protein
LLAIFIGVTTIRHRNFYSTSGISPSISFPHTGWRNIQVAQLLVAQYQAALYQAAQYQLEQYQLEQNQENYPNSG